MVSPCNCLCYWLLAGWKPVLYSLLWEFPEDRVWADIDALLGESRLIGERWRGALDSPLLGRLSNSSSISINLGDGDPLSKERAGQDRISMASLRQVGYPHLEKSQSYRSGGNWGNRSLGSPLVRQRMMRELRSIWSGCGSNLIQRWGLGTLKVQGAC